MFMDIGGYRHNFEGFWEKFTYLMSINKEKMNTIEGAHTKFMKSSLLSFFALLVKIIEEEI